MREHNRSGPALQLLAEIDKWCARTATPENVIGAYLFRHGGFVGLLRLRHTVSEEKEEAVRQFMTKYPDGFHGALPKCNVRMPKKLATTAKFIAERGQLPEKERVRLSEAEIAARRVNREACTYCGVRADIGCRHRRSLA